ncbi:aminodeoxychorismate lyase [Psychrobium sp. MM17-31]|uniref:aminodeoxychorismate lyase n=1 Tax=Psychrobium sp. MM17-31 TaxID=2917758 RepID=UPI001EF6E863|nr:aminodeoxychorismate lyase [Psychrobium sp. MM17-31]MCG7531529.1 aminodeoxychorismate lyase [Psychrobium sp. MM17-31]
MSMMWVNGVATDVISASDRGFSYGDGIFTTIKVTNGVCHLLPDHLMRLQRGISALAIAQIDFDALLNQLCDVAKMLAQGVIKVVISRGVGQRGYSSVGCDSPTVVVSTSPLPSCYQAWQRDGIALGVSTVALGLNPLTAGIKHLNRLEQVLVKQQIDDNGWTDAVVLDCQACVIETNMANLFWRNGDKVYTPNLDFSGVKGLMRAQVKSALAAWAIEVVEDRFKLSSLTDADEIFITNCLMDVVPVVAIETKSYAIGSLTKRLIAHISHKDHV